MFQELGDFDLVMRGLSEFYFFPGLFTWVCVVAGEIRGPRALERLEESGVRPEERGSHVVSPSLTVGITNRQEVYNQYIINTFSN